MTQYTYSPGRTGKLLTQVKDALGHTTTFGYDDLGRLTSVTNALGQQKTSTYDAKGNLIQTKNASGQVTTYEYDANDRLTKKHMVERRHPSNPGQIELLSRPLEYAALESKSLAAQAQRAGFTMGLALKRHAAYNSVAPNMTSGEGRPPYRVLVVDDYPPVRRMTAKLLSGKGYEAHEARDAAEALDALRRRTFDLMLLDLKLGPPIDGTELLRKLRAAPGTRGLPVIAMSGVAQPGEVTEALTAGAWDFVAKGENDRVLKTVEQALTPGQTGAADVLYVEDEDEWADLVAFVLRQDGLKTHRVRDRSELLVYLSSDRPLPGCLVADLSLGAEDGLLLCDELKASPMFQSLPIIVFTGKPVSSGDCLSRKALYRVPKAPGAEAELRQAVASVLAQQERSRGIIDAGDVRVDTKTGHILRDGREAARLKEGLLSAFVFLVRRYKHAVPDEELYGAFLSRGPYRKPENAVAIQPIVTTYVYKLRNALGEPLSSRIVRLDEGYAYRP